MGATSRGGHKGSRVCYMPAPSFRYREIADDLRVRIRAGEYAPGDQLPTGAEMMEHYEARGINTIKQALDILKAEGLIDSRGGRRTRVSDPLPEKGPSESERVQAQIADLQEQIRQLEQRLAEHEH